jgi:uncharacterized protein (DUF433 family)
MPALEYPHITHAVGDVARLERHPRIRVSMIVCDYLSRAWSAEEIALQYPHLTLAEIHAALAYYFDHRGEIDAELAAELAEAEHGLHESPEIPLRARLRAFKRRPAA